MVERRNNFLELIDNKEISNFWEKFGKLMSEISDGEVAIEAEQILEIEGSLSAGRMIA